VIVADPTAWTEQEFDGHLFRSAKSVARTLGWMSYHTLRSKGSASGFPDRVLVRERIVYAELKSEGGKLTAAQSGWLTALARAGAEVYLWRPSDTSEIDVILGRRQKFFPDGNASDDGGLLFGRSVAPWFPKSLWLPDGGRRDKC
jgi:hypothetical protein